MSNGSAALTATASTPLIPKDASTKLHPRKTRSAPLVDRIVPPLILLYMPTAYYQVTRRVLLAYVRNYLGRPLLAYALLAHTTLAVSLLLRSYLNAYLIPTDHSKPSFEPPEAINSRSVIYECADDEGDVARCFKGECAGSWKGARVRHCSVCNLCRSSFDHHCPWFSTCISSATQASFLAFLLLTPITVLPPTLPIIPSLYRHVWRVYAFSRLPAGAIERMWYRRWWSWVLGAGPIGRIGWGIVGGFWTWGGEERKECESGVLVLVVAVGWGVAVIATGLLISSLHSILTSSTPIEARIRSAYARRDPRKVLSSASSDLHPRADPRVRFFVPNPSKKGEGVVVRTRPEERPYDLGWRGNWVEWWRGGARDGMPKMIEAVEKRLKFEAGLRFDEAEEEAEEAEGHVKDLGSDESEDA